MDVKSFDSNGHKITNEKGELVCTSAFPSMPIYFWNDPEGKKYHNAYFSTFPKIWHHGDYIMINDHGGVKIFGRSDATLNPGGIRIGTAEIYRVVENFPGVEDSLVIGQKWEEDERVILFIKLAQGFILNDEFIQKMKQEIRKECSHRHIPNKILKIEDIPYTINGKKVEIAVKNIIHGEKILNKDALANPESLKFYENLPELKI
jgi:acetoacetyl-CoA synthetase